MDAGQQQLDGEEQLVYILKRIDVGTADHDDAVILAAALGLSRQFSTQLNSTRKELK